MQEYMQPLISILIPAYNVEAYVQAALESALSQSYPNIEVVVVDDGSQDATLAVLNEIGAKDPRVRIFTQANRGVMTTRGVTIEKARGEYLFFLDADDTLPPDAIEVLYHHLAEHALDIACGDCRRITDDYQFIVREKIDELLRGYAYAQMILTERSTAFLARKLYRATLFDSLIYPPGLNYAEDKFSNIQVAMKQPVVGYVPQVVYNYYRRAGSLSTQGPSLDYMIDYSNKVWALVQNEPSLYEAFVASKLHFYCIYINKTSNKDISNLDWVKELYKELTVSILKSNRPPHQRFIIRCFRRRWSAPLGKIAIAISRISMSVSKRMNSRGVSKK